MTVTKQAEAVWGALLTESTRMIATAGGEPPSALDQTLALQWALSPTTLFGSTPSVTREHTVGTERTPGDHIPPPFTPAIVQLPPVLAVIDLEQPISQLAEEDMRAQGQPRADAGASAFGDTVDGVGAVLGGRVYCRLSGAV